MSSGWFGRTEPSLATSSQGMGGAHALVRGCSSKPHDFRESKVCRVLSQVFGRVEPLRLQVTNLLLGVRGGSTECARCVEFFRRRSGWFESTKPSLTTALQGNKVCGVFKHIEPHRTFSNHMISERVKCVEFCHIGSGWFVRPKPLYLQRNMGYAGCFCTSSGGSNTSNLIEPSQPTGLQREQDV